MARKKVSRSKASPTQTPPAPPVESPPNPEGFDDTLFPTHEDYAAAQAAWAGGAEEAAKANPIGTFHAKIEEAILGRSASSDRLQIHYALLIVGGDSDDVTIHKYDGLETVQQIAISQQQLKRLGVPADTIKLPDLPAHLMQLHGQMVVLSTRQNQQYYNIYFQRLLGETLDGEAGEATPPAGSGGGGRF